MRPRTQSQIISLSPPHYLPTSYYSRTGLMSQTVSSRILPDCWGHRGASSRFPENTLASFEAAIRDGAEGIESDVHVSADEVIIMIHDASLDRVTDYSGKIKERNWYGENGMEHARTKKVPPQAIPTFAQTIDLLMKPENQHVKLNLDVKADNDPDSLFVLMRDIISKHADYETLLAPRILIGLWHPRFIAPAKMQLPHCKLSYIGNCTNIARKYFWADCDTFSMSFGTLMTCEGQKFMAECKSGGKRLMVWTVNHPDHMMEAVRWGVNVIITDVTRTWLELRSALQTDYEKVGSQYGRSFLWTTFHFYAPFHFLKKYVLALHLVKLAGPFDFGADVVKTGNA